MSLAGRGLATRRCLDLAWLELIWPHAEGLAWLDLGHKVMPAIEDEPIKPGHSVIEFASKSYAIVEAAGDVTVSVLRAGDVNKEARAPQPKPQPQEIGATERSDARPHAAPSHPRTTPRGFLTRAQVKVRGKVGHASTIPHFLRAYLAAAGLR